VLDDLRQATRSLARAPGFAIVAATTIALGVAANTAIFSMVEGVLLRRLPYDSGERLVHITQPSNLQADVRFSIPEILDYRGQSRTMDAVVEYHAMAFQLYGLGEPQRLQTGVVSDNFFQVLGVTPVLGRLFRPGEEAVGAPPVVLLSYGYWTSVLGANRNVIGSKFTMNDRVHTIVGVLPPLPAYPGANDIWVPAGACPFRSAPAAMASRTARLPMMFGRLKPDATPAGAAAEIAIISQRLHAAYPGAYPSGSALRVSTVPVREEMTAGSKPLLLILFSTALFLMIVAAANFAGLTVARQLRRGREIAVREALGAGRLRIFRQLAYESLAISIVGGIGGTLLAFSGLGLLRTFATRVTPRAGEIQIDGPVLAFAILTCAVVGLAAAAAPLIRAPGGPTLIDRLRQGNSAAMGGRMEVRIRRAFVFVQVAIAFVLLVAAGLVGRSLQHLQNVDAGFDGHNVLTARVSLNFTKYRSFAPILAFGDQLMQRLASTPGMSESAIANNFPLNNAVSRSQAFMIAGVDAKEGLGAPRGDFTSVSSKYFEVIGVPIRQGRAFTDADRDTSAVPVILSQHLATTYWGDRNPIGTRISTDSGKAWATVVGVAGDVRQTGLDKDVADEVYLPSTIVPPVDIRILVRFRGSSAPIASGLRTLVHSIDPQQAIVAIQTLEDVRGTRLSEPRLTTALLMSFAVVALVLAATGLAGVVGYSIAQRLPEIAIRMALGADSRRIIGLVGRDGLVVVIVGLGAGAVAALLLSKFAKSLLFGIQPNDAATYVVVALVLFATSIAACLGPARRAIAADPAHVLRGG
jgi:predicted permease